MATRSGSLPWVFLTSVLALVLLVPLWQFFDSNFLGTLHPTNVWQTGPVWVQTTRAYIVASWNNYLVILVLGMGMEAVVAARLTGSSSSNIITRGFSLLIIHIFMLLWVVIFPEILAPVFDVATSTQAVSDVGYESIAVFARDFVALYVPGFIVVAADVFHIVAPIRDDVMGAIR